MATRFYLTQVTSLFTPTVNAAWNVTTGNVVDVLLPYQLQESGTNLTSGATGAAAVRKILIRQFVSQPLEAQTINGTVSGQGFIRMSSVTARTGEGFIYFRIINKDGTVASEVGTLTTIAMLVTNINRTYIALTLTNVAVTAGQRFCFDIGWNYSTGVNTATTGFMTLRTLAAGDLPVNDTQTTAGNPWLEFSQTILLQSRTYFFF